MTTHSNAAGLRRVLELPMASLRHDRAPAVCFYEADDITYLHGIKLSALRVFGLTKRV